MGDPCHDWQLTYDLCEWLYRLKAPVIVTKHWVTISDELLFKLKGKGVVFNTSISALDAIDEISHRLYQFNRIKKVGISSTFTFVDDLGSIKVTAKLVFKNIEILERTKKSPVFVRFPKQVGKGEVKDG